MNTQPGRQTSDFSVSLIIKMFRIVAKVASVQCRALTVGTFYNKIFPSISILLITLKRSFFLFSPKYQLLMQEPTVTFQIGWSSRAREGKW